MSIKCNNCGWNNPDGAVSCQKCNSPLAVVGTQVAYNPRATVADANPRATMAEVNPRATVAEINPRVTVAEVNPRATMAEVNPRATVAEVNPRATVAEFNPRATVAEFNPRATVAEFNPRATVCEAPIANAKEYKLLCMDDRMGNIITLSSQTPLSLMDGEIVLLGGLRYKVL